MNEKIITIISAVMGAIYGYIFNEMPHAFNWLLIMIAVDYITGMMQAFKTKTWSSKTGFKGLIKKSVILTIVILFHGLSDIVHMPEIDTAVIFAFAINEICSILENVERMGLGSIIPKNVRKLLDIVGDTEIDKLNHK